MKDRVVIITGASSGIGLALAKEFDNKSVKLVLAARSIDKLDYLSKELKSEVITIKTDVSIEQDCINLIDKTIERFGKIDILINNAGISMRSLLIDTDISVIKKLMSVNFWGTVFCTKYALPHLLKTKGSVVAVSSIAGFKGLPARVGYSSSKFAIHGFLDVLRTENLKTGLHVLLVAPGFTKSNIRNVALTGDGSAQGETPRDEEKMMTSEEVAKHIVNAIAKRKRELILTTQGKLTVLLNKFFPKLMDKMVYNHMAKEADSPFK